MPKAVITSVDQNEQYQVVIKYDVFRDDGSLWGTLWLTLGLDKYSPDEVDNQIRTVLNNLSAREAVKDNPDADNLAKIQTDLINREILA